MDYAEQYEAYLTRANAALLSAAGSVLRKDSLISQAAQYSLIAGGKRVRAVLCLAVSEMLCGDAQLAQQYAAAVEMLHCYSLIHDDLPCMDNDDYRRGQLSCHKRFDEATALLAGDALLTAAFETLTCAQGTPQQNAEAVQLLAHAAGTNGMIYGQELDLKFEHTAATEKQLKEIHRNKTGMLINAAAQLGGISAKAFREDRERMEQYAFQIGLAFQIVDDVLDVTSTTQALGKPVGSDAKCSKTTFVTLYGAEASLEAARELTQSACQTVEEYFGERAHFLIDLARQLAARKA